MSGRQIPGRSLVTRRAILEIVRAAALESYGVTGLADPDLRSRLCRWFGIGSPAIRIDVAGGLGIELFVTVAYGVPVAEVARQVDSAVRYALRRTLAREVGQIVIHVGGLRYQPARPPIGGAVQQPTAGTEATGGTEGTHDGGGRGGPVVSEEAARRTEALS